MRTRNRPPTYKRLKPPLQPGLRPPKDSRLSLRGDAADVTTAVPENSFHSFHSWFRFLNAPVLRQTGVETRSTFSTHDHSAGVRASALEDEESAANLQAAKAATPTKGFGLRKTHVFRYAETPPTSPAPFLKIRSIRGSSLLHRSPLPHVERVSRPVPSMHRCFANRAWRPVLLFRPATSTLE